MIWSVPSTARWPVSWPARSRSSTASTRNSAPSPGPHGTWSWRGVSGCGRPSRTGAGGRWSGCTQPVDPVLPALGALELLHTFALVHDDVMDNSATRRGSPTAHQIFAAQHVSAGRTGDAAQFGSASAILVGDLCMVLADQLLARAPLPPATLFAVRRGYDRMRIEAVAGQYLDVLGETRTRFLVGRTGAAGGPAQDGQLHRPAAAAVRAGAGRPGHRPPDRTRRGLPLLRRIRRRGVPASRRPARGVRRPGRHRQTRR